MDSIIASIRDTATAINSRSKRTEILAHLPFIQKVLSEISSSPVIERYPGIDEYYWCFWIDETSRGHPFAVDILGKIGVKYRNDILETPVGPPELGKFTETHRDFYFIETDEDGRPIVPLNTSILDALDRLYKDPFNTEHSLEAFMELIDPPRVEEPPVPPAPKPSRQRRTTPSTTTTNSSPPSTTRRGRHRT